MSRVVPHTRDCCSHWDGECSCAPRTREELQRQIDYLIDSERRWEQRAQGWLRQREAALAEVARLRNALLYWAEKARALDEWANEGKFRPEARGDTGTCFLEQYVRATRELMNLATELRREEE